MNATQFIKDRFGFLPFPVGRLLSKVPYGVRPGIGRVFSKRVREIQWFENASSAEKQEFVFDRVRRIVQHAVQQVEFYRVHYARNGFDVEQLKDFASIERIPLVTKQDLQQFDLEKRSYAQRSGAYLVNTGGSSGRPMGFYISTDSIGHERAHMMKVWSKFGYKASDLIVTFGGRSQLREAVQYDALRHAYFANIYADTARVASEMLRLLKTRDIRFLHGYPSAIYEFAIACDSEFHELRDALRRKLRGVFLGSEFPAPRWRETIESVFGIPSVSWYGHTERCVLAYEVSESFVYCPFQTYGLAEAVNVAGQNMLVGTSYYNFASPLIRYNTEDEIDPLSQQDGLVGSFRMVGGRSGEFVLDRSGKKIPLTGLVFGRHHELFNHCSHIQVSQDRAGAANILYTPSSGVVQHADVSKMFDSSNVDIEFQFVKLNEPVKTVSGKVRLLVPAAGG